MFKESRWLCVAFAIAICLFGTTVATATTPRPVPVPVVECPPVPCCCEDARICVIQEQQPVCYTQAGLAAFISLYRDAAALGVENATIRAFNATKVAPDCKPCDDDKK